MEGTLVSWRNDFTADVYGELGSAHISSLCKWGPSTFTVRTRVLPSGRPPEESVTLVQPDPTWTLEYSHFRRLVEQRALVAPICLRNDLILCPILNALSEAALGSPFTPVALSGALVR